MSKIKNDGLDHCGAEPFEQQQFGTAGVEGVNSFESYRVDKHTNKQTPLKTPNALRYTTTTTSHWRVISDGFENADILTTSMLVAVPLWRRDAVRCVWSHAGHREPLQVIASTLQRGQLTARHRQVHHTVIAEWNERQMRWYLRWVIVAVREQRWFLEVQVRHVASARRTSSAAVETTQSLLSVH